MAQKAIAVAAQLRGEDGVRCAEGLVCEIAGRLTNYRLTFRPKFCRTYATQAASL